LNLLSRLADSGFRVSLETSGALDISDVDDRVTIVMDIKTPASGELDRNRWENLERLKSEDQIKFVVCDRQDYEWARGILSEHDLTRRVSVLFSPAWGQGIDRPLAEWILEDRLEVRFQMQLHKILWGETPGH
jgi:7-carboxy-7-deazaguanine synthase